MNKLSFFLCISYVVLAGCSSDRLYYADSAHLGLKVEANANSTTPANVNFGYKRAFYAVIPCKITHEVKNSNGNKKEFCGPNPDEDIDNKNGDEDNSNNILSVISMFNSKVTWSEGTEIHTYFATGEAATNTAKKVKVLKELAGNPKNQTARQPEQ